MATELVAARPGGHTVERAATVSWLVDNGRAYDEALAAIERAEQSVWLTQLAFDADCLAYGESPEDDEAPRALLDALLAASARGVAVRIILNESLLLDTATPLRAAIERAGAADIRVRGISRFPQLLHAKMLVVDEREALLLGSPFVNGYFDTPDHPVADGRRPMRELAGRPIHDLSLHVTGAPVRALGAIFAELWNDASIGADEDAPIECRAPIEAEPGAEICVVRTAPRHSLRQRPDGVTEILTAIERGLAEARSLVYVEHQYLSSRRVVAALERALRREPALEVVMVVNQNPDVTAYRGWQNVRLRAAGLLEHPRVGVFALWRAAPAHSPDFDWAVNQLFLHSKALIVDDRWLTAGSANLDGVSLHSYGDDFSSRLGRRVFRDVRNFDVNLTVRGGDDPLDNPVRALREMLWAEHLGVGAGTAVPNAIAGGLARWRAAAAAGTARLSAPPSHREADGPMRAASSSVVLPYSVRPRPCAQLADAGVRSIERIDIRFNPGWIERNLSPNWVRNMFA